MVLATLTAIVTPQPASAADESALRTTITSLTPAVLGEETTVTLSGRVTNTGDTPWTDLQAYLVIPRQPLQSATELERAVDANPGYAGPRVVDIGRFDEVGDLPAGATRDFRVRVPGDELPIADVDGVFPVGVQILATDDQGLRGNDSVSRAITLLPRMTGDHAEAPATVVWPFLMPDARGADGLVTDVADLVSRIGPDGQLRRLLDAARRAGPDARGVVVDPALVVAVDTLAEGGDPRVDDPADREAAAAFRDDLIDLAAGPSARTLDFDRTDVLGLSRDGARGARLLEVADDATSAAIERFGLPALRLSWPTPDGTSSDLLDQLATGSDRQVLLTADDLAAWREDLGPLLQYSTPDGGQELVVDDDVTVGLPGDLTAATLRQRVVASSAFASLARDEDDSSAAAALAVVDPTWDPGPDPAGGPVPDADFIAPTSLDDLAPEVYSGAVVAGGADPISGRLTSAVGDALQESQLLTAAADDSRAVDAARAMTLASLLGVRWRDRLDAGVRIARSASAGFRDDLAAITVMGPTSVTLSSSQGAFPLTISNGSDEPVSVGVRLSSSNPALDLPEQGPVDIAAGERLTMTVDLDLAQQNATTVTAQLTTPDGQPFGETSEFNVRSSSVGAVLWITMGAAGLFVLFALVRRFRKRPAGEQVSDD